MLITGEIWAKEIKEVHPGSITGQDSETVTYYEKKGSLKVQIRKSELLHLLINSDTYISYEFKEALSQCEYPNLITEIDETDIQWELING